MHFFHSASEQTGGLMGPFFVSRLRQWIDIYATDSLYDG
jgi:hypothetical protein